MLHLRLALAALVLAASVAPAARAALPAPPDQVAYSGVLSVPGPVDLTARLYDAASGGTLVFKQSFTNVAVSDGHFTVNLGPTGEATDTPANPLTTSLRTALGGELAAGPGRFVEVTVNPDPPLARVQLVLVPYALRADHALTADVATQALDTQAVAGLDGGVLTELFEHYTEDGGPPASDPSEGSGDPDGDGEMNFVDPDNDEDGLSDADEGTAGTNINLVTPRIAGVDPDSGSSASPTPVTVTGTGFLPGLTADFGAQQFTPPAVSPTSFELTLGPEPSGTVLNLTVTNPNGESHHLFDVFTFGVTGVIPLPFTLASPASIVVRGQKMLVYGSQEGGARGNRHALDVDGDGDIDLAPRLSGTVPSALGLSPSGVLHALRGQGATGQIQLLVDANGNHTLPLDEAVALETPGGTPITVAPSIAFDAASRPGGGYVRNGQHAVAFHDRDGNGLFTGVNEVITIEAVTGASLGEAGFDAAGRVAYAYRSSAGLRLAWDRSGDGDFDDTVGGVAELRTIAGSTGGCLGLAFDTAGRLAIVNGQSLFRDLTGDGDFADPGETFALSGACDVTAASQGDRIAIAWLSGGALHLLVDLDGDGGFADPGEDVTLAATAATPIAITETGTGQVRVLTPQGVVIGPVR